MRDNFTKTIKKRLKELFCVKIKIIGDYMKKNLYIFIFISCSLLIISFFNLNIEKKIDEPVSSVLEDKVIRYLENDLKDMIDNPLHFNYFYLLFDQYYLNSQNIIPLFKFFDDHNYQYQFFEIYPYLNPLFKEVLSNVERISLKGDYLPELINDFYVTYINELEKHHLDDEIEKYIVSGIPIRMVKINTSNAAMYYFLKQNNDIKYSLNRFGLFKKLINN